MNKKKFFSVALIFSLGNLFGTVNAFLPELAKINWNWRSGCSNVETLYCRNIRLPKELDGKHIKTGGELYNKIKKLDTEYRNICEQLSMTDQELRAQYKLGEHVPLCFETDTSLSHPDDKRFSIYIQLNQKASSLAFQIGQLIQENISKII
ncbi:hypothetical protein FACS189465_1810 [Clostridia bacterium]|nr:hypothetical protein FACS189465_1810 [Clostridia bacterium]